MVLWRKAMGRALMSLGEERRLGCVLGRRLSSEEVKTTGSLTRESS
jgi:hypothetical protein